MTTYVSGAMKMRDMKMIEYWYKENCDYCVNGCKECGHFGYTESDAASKDEIPLDAFDIEEIKTS